LNAAGLPELAMADEADYVNAITALALDPALLAGYRRHLVEQRLALPLFDSGRYGAAFADLLQRMWQRWTGGQPAAHLPAQG
jgi:predicted O-linked N-acetylglucosamine transferase (SPINDLY family)